MKFGTFYPFVLALLPIPALAHTDVNAAYDGAEISIALSVMPNLNS